MLFEAEVGKVNGISREMSLQTVLFVSAIILSSCGALPTDAGMEKGADRESGAGESNGESLQCPDSLGNKRILVDASHDGGVWWFPQSWTFDPNLHHQGWRLAHRFRECGYEVEELGRGTVVTDSILLSYSIVIRAGKYGAYREAELNAYERYVSRETTLILLSEGLGEGETDPVAGRIGLHFVGSFMGQVTEFGTHPITEGERSIPYFTSSGLLEFDESRVTVLGRLQGVPVMGLLKGYPAKIFFMGDTNSLETVPQPLVDNLMAWGF